LAVTTGLEVTLVLKH